jgi:hypothetical protein
MFKERECLLSLIKSRNNVHGDTSDEKLRSKIEKILGDIYVGIIDLPFNEKQKSQKKEAVNRPFDYMFFFSLLLYTGKVEERKLIYYFWVRTSHPIACLLNAKIIFSNLEKYASNKLKTKLDNLSRYFVNALHFKLLNNNLFI